MLIDRTLNNEYRKVKLLTGNPPTPKPDMLEESPEIIWNASVVGICILAAGVVMFIGCQLGGVR